MSALVIQVSPHKCFINYWRARLNPRYTRSREYFLTHHTRSYARGSSGTPAQPRISKVLPSPAQLWLRPFVRFVLQGAASIPRPPILFRAQPFAEHATLESLPGPGRNTPRNIGTPPNRTGARTLVPRAIGRPRDSPQGKMQYHLVPKRPGLEWVVLLHLTPNPRARAGGFFAQILVLLGP